MPGTRKLGKTTAQRMAMLRQQVTDLLDKGRMETTVTRAKEIAPMAEKMITLGKAKDLASYRQALSFITREDVAKKVFDEVAPKYADRNGGYTSMPTATAATLASPASAPAAATLPRWRLSNSSDPKEKRSPPTGSGRGTCRNGRIDDEENDHNPALRFRRNGFRHRGGDHKEHPVRAA